MAFTPLAPSAQDRSVSLTVPKEKDPYLVEWYQETKLNGEGVNAFVLRHLMGLARDHQKKKLEKSLTDQMLLDAVQAGADVEFIGE